MFALKAGYALKGIEAGSFPKEAAGLVFCSSRFMAPPDPGERGRCKRLGCTLGRVCRGGARCNRFLQVARRLGEATWVRPVAGVSPSSSGWRCHRRLPC